jgi:hypothetical protein
VLPTDYDLATIQRWSPEMQAQYILALQESLQRMRPIVAAAQDFCLAGDKAAEQTLALAVDAYRLPVSPTNAVKKRSSYQDL